MKSAYVPLQYDLNHFVHPSHGSLHVVLQGLPLWAGHTPVECRHALSVSTIENQATCQFD